FFVSLCLCVNDPAPTGIYTLSLHDALPILVRARKDPFAVKCRAMPSVPGDVGVLAEFHKKLELLGEQVIIGAGVEAEQRKGLSRSEEHTSELQSRENLVCRLLLEKKKKNTK